MIRSINDSKTQPLLLIASALILVVGMIAALPMLAGAATVQVSDETSLRAEVLNAGVNATTIEVMANFNMTQTLVIPAGSDITLTSGAGGPFILTRATTMIGTDAASNGRVILVSGRLTLTDIILDGNKANVTAGSPLIHVAANGTLVLNSGAVVRNNCNSRMNVSYQGGGIHGDPNSTTEIHEGAMVTLNQITNASETGAGIYMRGHLIMDGGEISYNTVLNGGGGICFAAQVANEVTIFDFSGGAIAHNSATSSDGGGIHITSANVANASITLNISGTAQISENTAARSGGGIRVEGYVPITLNISGGSIHDNTAKRAGGGIDIATEVATINMSGGSISDNETLGTYVGTQTDIGFGGGINTSGTVTITGGEIVGNHAAKNGGGISLHYLYLPFSITDCDISDNVADNNGGGIYFYGFDETNTRYAPTITGTALSRNTAGLCGGAIHIDGAAVSDSKKDLTLTLDDCVVGGNEAGADGGGIWANWKVDAIDTIFIGNKAEELKGGALFSQYLLDVNDYSSFENNTAGLGGGIYNAVPGVASVSGDCVFYRNIASGPDTDMGSGGAIFTEKYADLTVASGAEFSLNEAPTLRVVDLSGQDIDSSGVADLAEYDANIGGLVQEANLIDAMAGPLRNAPGYNNFDINYLADHYLVTVNDSFATNSGAGAYTAGSTVTIDAGTRTGYRFVGWTVDSGNATLANPDSPMTTFVMPADHVVVTAHWEADQPDPGPDPDPVDPDKPDQPDPDIPDTGDSNGGVLLLSSALIGIGIVTIPVLRAKKSMAF